MKKIILQMLLVIASVGFAQAQTKITGKVTDAEGKPLDYVSISVKEVPTAGAFTDAGGNYTLNVPSGGSTLVFSYIGYVAQEVAIGTRSIINITLESDAESLTESLVVAYGTVKSKESFTGSVSVVKGEDIQKRTVSNVTKALEGVAPGIVSTSGSGQPGSDAQIQLRGWTSINASTSPLYVIDGIPFDGAFQSINQNDIETMSVLKDASASALYGSRAANGVVIITTKKGLKGRTNINYKGTVGISSRSIKRYDVVNQAESIELTYEALKNNYLYSGGLPEKQAKELAAKDLGTVFGGGEFYNPYKNYTWATLVDPSTGKIQTDAVSAWNEDWMDEIAEDNALKQEHLLSLSGGTDNTQHLISLGYIDEQGVLKTTKFTRFSVRANVTHQAKDWIKASANLSYSYTKSNATQYSDTQTGNAWYTAQFMSPVYPMYLKDESGKDLLDENGNRQFDYGEKRSKASKFNVLGDLYDNQYQNNRDNVGIRTSVELGSDKDNAGILKGLKLKVNFGGDLTNRNRLIYYNMYHGDAATSGGDLTKSNLRDFSYTLNQLLTYSRIFEKHSIDFLFGHEYYDWKESYLMAERTGLFPGIIELSPAVNLIGGTSYTDVERIESFLSKITYGFDDKYYISASWRTDGSSRFHKDYRWGNFWSIGASWRISEEKFMEKIEFINELAIKASYGLVGNQQLNDELGYPLYYAWQSFYDLGYKNAANAGGFATSLENILVTWEKVKDLNIGLSASLFNRVLNVELEFYSRKTTDMLMMKPMPMSSGFTSYAANVGAMENKGVETSIGVRIFNKENFKWSATLNLAHNKNKVTDIPSTITSGTRVIAQGKEIYTYYMVKSAGVDPATGSQLYWAYEKDANGNKIDGSDYVTGNYTEASNSKYYLGSRQPKLIGSFGSNFTIFKNFDLSFLTTFSAGGKIYESVYAGIMEPMYYGDVFSAHVLRRWQKPGDITDVPRMQIGSALQTDRYLVNASFFTIKNVTFGYTLPEKISKKIDIKSIRIFFALDNIIMFNHLNGMDPQYNFSGGSNYAYAPTRTISIGLDVNF
ncbi:MAG: TonB-dependent receptor [Prevotellaceae bacterium]|jgi:TonB-linked SusC/RagA family outer membrane protein|nr:TonB-dependent receptor [Prevotellaceae bacterium]